MASSVEKDAAAAHAQLVATFESGATRPLAFRRAQLLRLEAMVKENEEAILDAVRQDLGRTGGEALMYDVLLPAQEAALLRRHLSAYTRPRRVGATSLLTWPSHQWLEPEPLGAALIIGTWNFPLMLSLEPLAGAIAAGCTACLKPCNVAPATAKLQARLIKQYMDPAAVRVVGAGEPGDRAATGALLALKWDKVFFTGSSEVGKVVARACAEQLTPCTLELGGKNPALVAADAALDLAAKRVVWGRMLNAGQQCISPDYALVEEGAVDEFCALCAKHVAELYPRPEEDGNFGRIVGPSQMRRVAALLDDHRGDVVCGGAYDAERRFVAPTVIRCGWDSPLMRGETFAPILAVLSVPSLEAACAKVRERPKPLSLYVFSQSRTKWRHVIENTSAGGVTVNGTIFHAGHHALPFGGVGASGIGRYHGRYSVDCFSHEKPVLRKPLWYDWGLLSDAFVVYPPWSAFKLNAMRAVTWLTARIA